MPRISFDHPLIDEWYAREGEGTSTFDLCNRCTGRLKTASNFRKMPKGYNGDPIPPDAKVTLTYSDHPDIDETDYKCENCNCKLTHNNYD